MSWQSTELDKDFQVPKFQPEKTKPSPLLVEAYNIKAVTKKPIKQIKHVGRFQVVSKDNYENIIKMCRADAEASNKVAPHYVKYVDYNEIKIPRRATEDSAGYDFFLPHDICLMPQESVLIHTMIRVSIDTGWMLTMFPKSGLSYKYYTQLANTIGVVDGDYYHTKSDDYSNEGQITVKMINNGDQVLSLPAGAKFVQGIFIPYGITDDDDEYPKKKRNGGFGSTGQ